MDSQIKKPQIDNEKSESVAYWESELLPLEVPRQEVLISPYSYDALAELQTESIFGCAQEPCSDGDSSRIWKAMQSLTPREREIIHLIFWRQMSERDVGAELGISRSSVKVLKSRAFRKLAKSLVTHSPLVEAPEHNASEME